MIRSRPHRAVLALIRAGLGLPVDAAARADVAASDPHGIVAIARAHRLLQVFGPGLEEDGPLADALEPDARLFFREMRRGNAQRNAALRAVLEEVGQVLAQAGLEAVVLKGGAELVRPLEGDASARFIGDLDLLLADEEAAAAQELLIGAGWRETHMADVERGRHYHMPALVHPERPCMVELHRRPGVAALAAALPGAELRSRSEPSGLPGLRLPDAVDRLRHFALHAQFGGAGWDDRRLRLCDPVDLARLSAGQGAAAVAGARARARPGSPEAEALDGLLMAAHLLLPEIVARPEASPRAAAWARRAVARIGRTGALRRSYLARRARERLAQFLSDPERRAHWRRKAGQKGGLRAALAELRRDMGSIS